MTTKKTKATLAAAQKKLKSAQAEVAAAQEAENARLVAKNKGGRWFTFSQNNSGGRFVVNEIVCETVIIEADSAAAANARAEALGIYFHGCATGDDCGCCGDRWYPATEDDDGKPEPMVYDQKASEYVESFIGMRETIYVYPKAGAKIVHRPRKQTLAESEAALATWRAEWSARDAKAASHDL